MGSLTPADAPLIDAKICSEKRNRLSDRVRERLVSQRTGIINQIRAFLLERGIVCAADSGSYG